MDFFEAHENFDVNTIETIVPKENALSIKSNIYNENSPMSNSESNIATNTSEATKDSMGPSVNLSDSNLPAAAERKCTIGGRKIQQKRTGVSSIKLEI